MSSVWGHIDADGTVVQGNLRCASDSYQFQFASRIERSAVAAGMPP